MLRLTPKSTDTRIERGLRIHSAGLVRQISNGCFVVKSESSDAYYIVRSDTGCNCPDAMQRNFICKHQWAAYASAAMTIWRIQLADTRAEIEQLSEMVLAPLPAGIRRTILTECDHAAERLPA
jgi:hypothetical protein